jgi:hypothetical protein
MIVTRQVPQNSENKEYVDMQHCLLAVLWKTMWTPETLIRFPSSKPQRVQRTTRHIEAANPLLTKQFSMLRRHTLSGRGCCGDVCGRGSSPVLVFLRKLLWRGRPPAAVDSITVVGTPSSRSEALCPVLWGSTGHLPSKPRNTLSSRTTPSLSKASCIWTWSASFLLFLSTSYSVSPSRLALLS